MNLRYHILRTVCQYALRTNLSVCRVESPIYRRVTLRSNTKTDTVSGLIFQSGAIFRINARIVQQLPAFAFAQGCVFLTCMSFNSTEYRQILRERFTFWYRCSYRYPCYSSRCFVSSRAMRLSTAAMLTAPPNTSCGACGPSRPTRPDHIYIPTRPSLLPVQYSGGCASAFRSIPGGIDGVVMKYKGQITAHSFSLRHHIDEYVLE